MSITGSSGMIVVQPGASVTNSAGNAAVVSTGFNNILNVFGSISGSNAAGITVQNGAYFPGGINPDPYAGAGGGFYTPPGYRAGQLDVRIAASGSITGDVAIRADAVPNATAYAMVSNEGSLTGTSGVAIATGGGVFQRFSNQVTGTITGALQGAFNIVSNLGAIQAGDRAAIALTAIPFSILSVSNGGSDQSNATAPQAALITNASAVATITLPEGYLTNTGTIRN
ncbi:MAG: hypothetical protein EOP02_30980, partial [Proteobacteria bacterium]